MKKVVIIGGGFAGSMAAKRLERHLDVTLVDTKSYFEFTPGILRTIAHPTRQRCMQIEHSKYLKGSRIVIGKANEITGKHVIVNGKKIEFDYLILAMGSSYKAPFKHLRLKVASRAHELSDYHHDVVKASNVLVVGGGLVGVELAAEIKHYFPDKEVIIAHSKDRLLERLPSKAQDYALRYFDRHGVGIVFNERVAERDMKADIAFACIGITPNSDPLRKNFGKELDERGFVSVDSNLRLKGHGNIFVAGDLTDIKEEKTAQNAEKHAGVIIRNLLRIENGNEHLEEYHSSAKRAPMVVSLGPKDGIFVWGNFVLTGLIPAILKWLVEKKELVKKRI